MKATLDIDQELYTQLEEYAKSTGRSVNEVMIEGAHRQLKYSADLERAYKVVGILEHELAGRSVDDIMDELRGPVELPPFDQKS